MKYICSRKSFENVKVIDIKKRDLKTILHEAEQTILESLSTDVLQPRTTPRSGMLFPLARIFVIRNGKFEMPKPEGCLTDWWGSVPKSVSFSFRSP